MLAAQRWCVKSSRSRSRRSHRGCIFAPVGEVALRVLGSLAALAVAAGCARAPHHEFFRTLRELCGGAFEGRLVEGGPQDSAFRTNRLVMHVRGCSADEIRIPFHVGDNRSRTWVITRPAGALRLKHDHRHEDGTSDTLTMYGGDARLPGTARVQEFPADSATAAMLPAARTNVWTLEIAPRSRFVYALRREGTDRRVRVEFDLTRAVEPPPPPWGAR
jgi:hypothetical protein